MTHEEFVTQLAKSLRADGFSCWVSENCCTVEVSWATTSDAGNTWMVEVIRGRARALEVA